jgi:hypothetical protein
MAKSSRFRPWEAVPSPWARLPIRSRCRDAGDGTGYGMAGKSTPYAPPLDFEGRGAGKRGPGGDRSRGMGSGGEYERDGCAHEHHGASQSRNSHHRGYDANSKRWSKLLATSPDVIGCERCSPRAYLEEFESLENAAKAQSSPAPDFARVHLDHHHQRTREHLEPIGALPHRGYTPWGLPRAARRVCDPKI